MRKTIKPPILRIRHEKKKASGQSGMVGKMVFDWGSHFWHSVFIWSTGIAAVFGGVGIAAAFVAGMVGYQVTEFSLEKGRKDQLAANVEIEKSKKDARDALVRAAGLEKEAAESKERTKTLELELAKIKLPRLLSEDRIRLLAEKLKPFASTPFDLAFIPGDPEAAIFGIHIATMLEVAGWKWMPWAPEGSLFQQTFTITGTDKPNIGQVGFFDVGIFLKPGDPDSLAPPIDALIKVLKGEGFAVTFETSANPNINTNATVHITVGRKR